MRRSMKSMSSGMSVLRIQKLWTTSAGKMNSIPVPSASSLRHISPRVRERAVVGDLHRQSVRAPEGVPDDERTAVGGRGPS